MKTFLNWNEEAGVSANTYCRSDGPLNTEILGFVDDILSGYTDSHFSGDLRSALDALEDGELLATLVRDHDEDEAQLVVEDVHSVIREALSGDEGDEA